MTREEAIIWATKYASRRARKTHVDHNEYMRRVTYIVNKLYDDFEQQAKKLQKENEHLKNMLQAHTKEK